MMRVWHVCLTSDVCLSVAYIGPKSRTQRPRKTKIGTEVADVTRDSFYIDCFCLLAKDTLACCPSRFYWCCPNNNVLGLCRWSGLGFVLGVAHLVAKTETKTASNWPRDRDNVSRPMVGPCISGRPFTVQNKVVFVRHGAAHRQCEPRSVFHATYLCQISSVRSTFGTTAGRKTCYFDSQ